MHVTVSSKRALAIVKATQSLEVSPGLLRFKMAIGNLSLDNDQVELIIHNQFGTWSSLWLEVHKILPFTDQELQENPAFNGVAEYFERVPAARTAA